MCMYAYIYIYLLINLFIYLAQACVSTYTHAYIQCLTHKRYARFAWASCLRQRVACASFARALREPCASLARALHELAYVHMHMRTYVHTYVRTYVHTYTRTDVHACRDTAIQAYRHADKWAQTNTHTQFACASCLRKRLGADF